MPKPDAKPAMPTRSSTRLTGITAEGEAYLAHRSREIQKATQRKGMPMMWGAGKERLKVPPMPDESA